MNSNKNNRNKLDDFDDFYGSDDNDNNENNNANNVDYLSNKDLDRSIQRITPIGYSDGLEIGKELTLQRGFNEGFKQSSEISYKWSLLLGLVSSVDVFFHHNKQFVSSDKDTSILGDLVDKINKMIKEHCCSPTIEQLKEEFINFKDLAINEQEVANNTTTEMANKSCKNEKEDSECCGVGNCGSNNSDTVTTTTTTTTTTITDSDCDSNSDGGSGGCCGDNGSNDEGCCKSKNQQRTTEKKAEEFQFIIEKMDGQLFEQLSKECVETISSFGLDGQKMLDDCLFKKFRVTIN